MNKYIRAMVCFPCCVLKMGVIKIFHFKNAKVSLLGLISPFTEITVDKKSTVRIGCKFRMRDGAKIRVRKGANLEIGNNCSINSNNVVACHEKIIIGNNVQLSPNVQIYDHDHDYLAQGGISEMKYKTSPITIGDNVWIGASTVILRGTNIGDNCVIAAGSVIKGDYPSSSIIVQKRMTNIKQY